MKILSFLFCILLCNSLLAQKPNKTVKVKPIAKTNTIHVGSKIFATCLCQSVEHLLNDSLSKEMKNALVKLAKMNVKQAKKYMEDLVNTDDEVKNDKMANELMMLETTVNNSNEDIWKCYDQKAKAYSVEELNSAPEDEKLIKQVITVLKTMPNCKLTYLVFQLIKNGK